MAKWLVQFYPVYPAEIIDVYDLEVTKMEKPDNGLKLLAKNSLRYAVAAMYRHNCYRVDDAVYVFDNNSRLTIIEADNAKDLWDKFGKIMEKQECEMLTDEDKAAYISQLVKEFEL